MLQHPLLQDCGVRHGFGTRGSAPPSPLLRPRQVHGARVVTSRECADGAEADAVIAARGSSDAIAVVTADCVPVLAASADGRAVAAIHAGWRGLSAGVIEAGIDALRREGACEPLRAVIGPHIGPCCYEIDEPVLNALRHFDADLDAAATQSRPGHHLLDLGALARAALLRAGVSPREIAALASSCTSCDAQRFHSFRRDGPRAGRLVHWIAVRILDSAGSDA
jgi:purine-nucleoside/S-methyl-5'-thioadenosine phosphorylase / adenosine deaminase